MFSANENILLRQHKRRIIEYVESTIPESALELGTAVMVMQVSCQSPGCVPLETCVTVVFPRPPTAKKKKKKETKDEATVVEAVPSFPKPLLPNLPESQIGGSFKTRILKPLSDVTKEDVLDALPPSFTGGRRTWESVCIKARDVMFAQIGQIVGGDTSSSNNPTPKDVNERTMVAEYLKVCLQEYVDGGCVPPEWGLPFSKQGKGENNISKESKKETNGNDDGNNGIEKNNDAKDKESMDEKFGKGNFVFRRPIENDHDEKKEDGAEAAGIPSYASSFSTSKYTTNRLSGYNNATAAATNSTGTSASSAVSNKNTSSQQLLQQMEKHSPGIRRPGCPCCDPDSASNYADKLMF